MLKAPCRKDRNKKDPDFAAKLARAVAQMGKVNSRIEKLTAVLAATPQKARTSASGTSDTSHVSERELARMLLNAFDVTDEEEINSKSGILEREKRDDMMGQRAKEQEVAKEEARRRLAAIYRRFAQRRFPLTWKRVLRQEHREREKSR